MALRLVYVIISPSDEKIVKFGKSIVKAEKTIMSFFWAVPPGTQTVQTLAVDRALWVPALL